MGGWTVLTFDPVESTEWALRFAEGDPEYLSQEVELSKDYEHINKALCRSLINYRGITHVGVDGHEVYALHSYSGEDCGTIIEETSSMWERVVVLRANDTGSTGTARLYEKRGGDIEMADKHIEHQCNCCGGRTGKIAAAYMLQKHHIDAIANFHPHPTHTFENEEELGEYRN